MGYPESEYQRRAPCWPEPIGHHSKQLQQGKWIRKWSHSTSWRWWNIHCFAEIVPGPIHEPHQAGREVTEYKARGVQDTTEEVNIPLLYVDEHEYRTNKECD